MKRRTCHPRHCHVTTILSDLTYCTGVAKGSVAHGSYWMELSKVWAATFDALIFRIFSESCAKSQFDYRHFRRFGINSLRNLGISMKPDVAEIPTYIRRCPAREYRSGKQHFEDCSNIQIATPTDIFSHYYWRLYR